MALFTIDQDTLKQIKIKEIESARKSAFEEEADPLFFKYQRGEATQQEWLDKIAEIKARFPKPAI
jgi:hypothetical protein